MNFLLITVDSLRADRVGRNGYGRNTTPFLDELSSEAVFFERAYSPSSHTREAVPSILTGKYPSRAVTRTYRIRETTVVRLLSDEGYETGGFVCGPFFTARNGYEDGFDIFDSTYSRYSVPMALRYWWEILTNSQFRDGYDLNDAVVSFAEDAEEPFFGWAHYMDVHAPYNRYDEAWFGESVGDREAQATFRKAKHLSPLADEDDRQTLIDLYDNSVRYFDGVMRDLFERLDDAGLLDETVVFVTSDHGESLGEDGRYEHGTALSPELLRVPLWMHDGDSSETFEKPVSTVDILPTVAEIADVDVECDGVHLLSETEESLRDIRASHYSYLTRTEKELARV
ncbi:MAG: sulfatase [Halobacteriales archaeon]|nr:sulfatase [Halobacteriales archaeon]